MTDPMEAVLLRALADAVLADWAWHLDHGDYAAVAELFTEDALFVTGAVELRGRPAIEHRYTERERVRTTRHTYSGLRVSVAEEGYGTDTDDPPAQLRALSTWVSYAAGGPAPVDDVGVYLVADFHDVLTWCADERYRISERRIVPVFRDPSRAPVAG